MIKSRVVRFAHPLVTPLLLGADSGAAIKNEGKIHRAGGQDQSGGIIRDIVPNAFARKAERGGKYLLAAAFSRHVPRFSINYRACFRKQPDKGAESKGNSRALFFSFLRITPIPRRPVQMRRDARVRVLRNSRSSREARFAELRRLCRVCSRPCRAQKWLEIRNEVRLALRTINKKEGKGKNWSEAVNGKVLYAPCLWSSLTGFYEARVPRNVSATFVKHGQISSPCKNTLAVFLRDSQLARESRGFYYSARSRAWTLSAAILQRRDRRLRRLLCPLFLG